MAKAKDLMGKSGAAGLTGSATPTQSVPTVAEAAEHKEHGGAPKKGGPQKNVTPHGGQAGGGGGKTPVGQRPKV